VAGSVAEASHGSEAAAKPVGAGLSGVREVRQRVRASRGRSLEQIVRGLRDYLRGWRAYYGFSQTPSELEDLDQWIRRRLRNVAWRHWKRGPQRYAGLCQHGVPPDWAATTASSPRGPWHLSHSPALTRAFPNTYFAQLGLLSLAAPNRA